MIEFRQPFPAFAWPLAWQWANARRRQLADDFFPRTMAEFVESYSVRFANARTYGVWKNDNIGGVVIFERASEVVVTAHILLSRRLWGIPASDLRRAATLLFDAEPETIRIQAFVPAWNRLAIALAVRIGAKNEGTLRCATLRNDAPADAVVVGLTREDLHGTELRRGDEFGTDQRDGQQHAVEHVFAAAADVAKPARIESLDGSRGVKRGSGDAGRGGAADGFGELDQPDVGHGRKQNTAVPRKPRVRKVRSVGRSRPADGTRKAKPARRK